MPTIHLTTFVNAPLEKVFDLVRSIDILKKAMTDPQVEAVAGTITGLINLGESVTWRGRYLGKTRVLRSRITSLSRPANFTAEMSDGDFRSLKHEHFFKQVENGTLIIDYMHYELPYGFLGRMADRLFINKYLNRLIENRNDNLKKIAETGRFDQYLK